MEKESTLIDWVMSGRGRYLLGRALIIALAVMKEEVPYKQTSDINDMEEMLKSVGFPLVVYDREINVMMDEELLVAIRSAYLKNNGARQKQFEELLKEMENDRTKRDIPG